MANFKFMVNKSLADGTAGLLMTVNGVTIDAENQVLQCWATGNQQSTNYNSFDTIEPRKQIAEMFVTITEGRLT